MLPDLDELHASTSDQLIDSRAGVCYSLEAKIYSVVNNSCHLRVGEPDIDIGIKMVTRQTVPEDSPTLPTT